MKVVHYALLFLALAMLMAFLGFGILAGVAAVAAKGFFFLSVVALLGALISGFRAKPV